ncbi:hypothetical protein EN836_16800 [Mesorhizobium sp. M1C.F.Ca.ET.193.01.1.1]|uniref:hypothetical protein n=1 Tax=unclassified Mesorhizobium TaxID=325217 RepID=UPI000FD4A8A1|nr:MULTISPECIES: hypothetical protein [unclassified Mesorhizobium]TGQ53062.1 hypothetical protein EN853_16795 [Mesorhizobium sp. M1C.F.Ca.ET.210.01.1.1]TGS99022.1 hypothetical protein EN820_35530 [bacterium M00.F.Ca.ET.177.01.1.1]TGR06670.1 hypothetical protein EN847_16800 [Mesorhizobium sp. M1C.F.Ca.ET.204.01.1.1]TGR27193.1 hypothetical protein EN839_16800 [Mesorhizobium sp. M1C.F.Ca.ET.196.01.1.1]TGR49718.1 hypothetical protein EN838_16795 [Mesorhizobium sp. M1C.F.Ca.ET.195.01.1.1]
MPSSRDFPARPFARHGAEIDRAEALAIVREQIALLDLDLSGLTVVVGAATGYQALAASAAALANAGRVIALARMSARHPNLAAAADSTLAFSRYANVSERVEITHRIDSRRWLDVDLVANCLQVAPISRSLTELLPSRAVVSLMAEPWELCPGVVDFDACDEAGIKVAALNLSHPAIDLLPEFARLCCALLDDAGVDQRAARLAIVCNTPYAPFLEHMLREDGARVSVFSHPVLLSDDPWDVVVVAMRPSSKPPMDINSLGRIARNSRRTLLVQFSGGIDRSAASYFGLRVWPPKRLTRGQLGLPFDVLGPAPTIRRLTGGLKAAEAAYRDAELGKDSVGFLVKTGSEAIGREHA